MNWYRGMWDRLLAMSVAFDGGYVTECWAWLGNKNAKGYGRLSTWVAGLHRKVLAHRVSYETFIGPIPPGHEIDHKCQNTWCIAPSHLQPVTQTKNINYRDQRRRERQREAEPA